MNPADLFEFVDPHLLEEPSFLEEVRVYVEHLQEQLSAARAENADKANGYTSGVERDFLYAIIDQRAWINPRPKRKWYKPDTRLGDNTGYSRLTKKRGLCFHHTAVHGGFGVRANNIAQAEAHGMLPGARWHQAPTKDIASEEVARAIALGQRYGSTPYHAIMGPNSVLYFNLPFDWVTWHGNGANNDYLGVAWDANSLKEGIVNPDDLLADVEAILAQAEADHHDIEELTCHCAWTNKPNDPGAQFINEVIVPLAEAHALEIRWDFKAKPQARSMREVVDRAA